MTLLMRFSRLFKADVHGLLDAIEIPEVVLQQAIREMQETIDAGETNLCRLDQRVTSITGQLKQEQQRLVDLDQQIDFCFDENNELLAKSLLRRKLECQHKIQGMQSSQQSLIEEQGRGQALLKQQQQQLQTIRLESDNLAVSVSSPTVIQDDDIEVAFLREKQRRSQHSAAGRDDHG